ncbi:predicted protein [Streptomyces viridosporus ATCC 14672]|uniref:Predicted protein n=1 Tax=Streptomyces viridosporus (strain ATCC 14672 / DSM 40746 / JCM 4963 / KCTC 9882 / NRRL B-12104 / FH 1290) TaxID=566461 RepID=D6AAT5_STRV1|nr:hypothetical protein [Streptomyces viridosporus]EFE72620.1 predicted protein [Streptomyces viridosporus ATCC 14672]
MTAAVPTGPIDREPLPTRGEPLPSAAEQEATLREVLAAAGVEPGAYDDRIIEWLARWEWSTVATIASWVQRAAEQPTD